VTLLEIIVDVAIANVTAFFILIIIGLVFDSYHSHGLVYRFWHWLLRPHYAWRYRRALAKLDAVIEAQQVSMGNALMPSIRDFAQTIAAATGARSVKHMARSIRLARMLRLSRRWPGLKR
jgi:hypothetical protein